MIEIKYEIYYIILYNILFLFRKERKEKKKETSRAGLYGFTLAGIKSSYVANLKHWKNTYIYGIHGNKRLAWTLITKLMVF